MELGIILMVCASVLYVARLYFSKRNDLDALTNEVKAQAFALFLYAEKQDWIGEKKMKFAVETIMKVVDDSVLAKVIGRQTVEKWMQTLYDLTKSYLEKVAKK